MRERPRRNECRWSGGATATRARDARRGVLASWSLRRARGVVGVLGALSVLALAVPGRAADTVETPCATCRLWDGTMAGVPEMALRIEAEAAPNGVVMRVTSTDPQVGQVLWEMCTQRQRLLEGLQRGHSVSLCPDCQANVEAFDTLRIDLLRLPDGVLLLYTSTEPEVVHRLHALVAGTLLPL